MESVINKLNTAKSRREKSAAIDAARSELTKRPKFLTNKMAQDIIAGLEAENSKLKSQLATSRKASAGQTKPASRAPASTRSTSTASAAPTQRAFESTIPAPMTRDEFNAMPLSDRSAFLKQGGKLIND